MEFEWDPAKNASNAASHGITFEDSLAVFDDPSRLVMPARETAGERRRLCIGAVGPLVIAVVYTFRGQRVRLISARRARQYERERYRDRAAARRR